MLLFLFEIKFRLCSCLQAADVLVVAGYNEDACGYHNQKGYGVAASEDEEHDGKQNRKAHGCHRHKADGEKNDYKDCEADQPCAPIDKPNACKKGHNGFSALEIVPHGESVAEHAAKERKCRRKLSLTVHICNNKLCQEYGKNGFANVDCHNAKGCGCKAVESFKIGKARVFAALLTNILAINQARENDSTVNTAKQISKGGKCQAIEI